MDNITQSHLRKHSDFYKVMSGLIQLDADFQKAISLFAGYEIARFETSLSQQVDTIYEKVNQIVYSVSDSPDRKDFLYNKMNAILDLVENISLTLHSKSHKQFLYVLHHLIQARCQVLHTRWEFGCFAAIDAIRTAFLIYRRIDENEKVEAKRPVLGPSKWRVIRSHVQEALYEWEVAHKAVTLFGDKNDVYEQLSQETLHCLNELMISIHVKSPQHFNKHFLKLLNLYKPYCHHAMAVKAV